MGKLYFIKVVFSPLRCIIWYIYFVVEALVLWTQKILNNMNMKAFGTFLSQIPAITCDLVTGGHVVSAVAAMASFGEAIMNWLDPHWT